ncbi:hypothetical protein JK358_35725 [Nocardia sp. 2]|uniref:Excreted virulence factor EspC (Type VII ESX diderm) n=1 Tax=Nocardia acididurans TaxID=2802282 RepID=A0ABS1MIA1_9NOCA|nr:hypothetical protein [Nocardia acididurans]MBL1079765.1 hypothetical protein [Nocardia acididurans]
MSGDRFEINLEELTRLDASHQAQAHDTRVCAELPDDVLEYRTWSGPFGAPLHPAVDTRILRLQHDADTIVNTHLRLAQHCRAAYDAVAAIVEHAAHDIRDAGDALTPAHPVHTDPPSSRM